MIISHNTWNEYHITSSPNLNFHLHLSYTLVLCLVGNICVVYLYVCVARAWYYYIQINHFHLGKLIFVYPQMRLPISKSILQWYSVLKGEEKPYKNNNTYTNTPHTFAIFLCVARWWRCYIYLVCFPASAYMHRIQDAWRPGYTTTYWHERSYHIH